MLAGGPGAVLATVGIFPPRFVLVALSARVLPRFRRSAAAGALLDGVNAASLALLAAVTWHLARSAFVGAPTLLVGALSAAILLATRLNPTWLILAAVAIGVFVF